LLNTDTSVKKYRQLNLNRLKSEKKSGFTSWFECVAIEHNSLELNKEVRNDDLAGCNYPSTNIVIETKLPTLHLSKFIFLTLLGSELCPTK